MHKTTVQLNQFTRLYQDDDLLIVHKPAGLLVHKSIIDKRETLFATTLAEDMVKQKVYTVHRLDKPTSGILVFALNSLTASKLCLQFSERKVIKKYIAICRGWTEPEGTIDKPLQYQKDKITGSSKKGELEAQEALTNFKRIERYILEKSLNQFESQRYSLVELNPKTGRKHQLRRHLNSIHHPIIGDVRHGDRHHNKLFSNEFGLHRLYLAATEISFKHPTTGMNLHITCPAQDDFLETATKLKLKI